MTASGWIIMTISVGTVCALFGWCLWKVMTTPGESEHVHGLASEKTPDTEE